MSVLTQRDTMKSPYGKFISISSGFHVVDIYISTFPSRSSSVCPIRGSPARSELVSTIVRCGSITRKKKKQKQRQTSVLNVVAQLDYLFGLNANMCKEVKHACIKAIYICA